jgi:hypothetical protein
LDFEQLSDAFLRSTVCMLSLKKLNLNVRSIKMLVNNNSSSTSLEEGGGGGGGETTTTTLKDESWSMASARNKGLRVCVNFLQTEEAARKYTLVLNRFMPLETLR